MSDPEAMEQLDHVLRPIPAFAGHPTIGGKQPIGSCLPIDGDRDEMRKTAVLGFCVGCGKRERTYLLRQVHGLYKCVKVTVFVGVALFAWMGVVVVKRLCLRIENLA